MKSCKEILAENLEWANETFAKINKKLSVVTLRSRDKLPDESDENGMHKERERSWWTNGFWGGLNWLLYHYTGNEEYRKTAERSEALLDEAFLDVDGIHHDVGFMWHLTSGASYRLTGNKASRARARICAGLLSSRYVLNGGFIRAWNSKGGENLSIIDTMMNLALLYWASDDTEDDRFKQIAMDHADMVINDHIRGDGSVIHIAEHDRESREVIRTLGGQGVRDGSSWSRGQAWALYGFVISYLHTGEKRYLDTAKLVANYFISRCCDDWLPPADFRASWQEHPYYDSSAGACAACGLIELAKALPEDEGGLYMNGAVNILKAMTERFCNFDSSNDSVLRYGTRRCIVSGETKEQCGVHISLIYSDFFYTEAVLKLLGDDFMIW